MFKIIVCYILFGFILVIYGAQVCPFLEDIGYVQAFLHTFIPIVLALPLRISWYRRNMRRLRRLAASGDSALYVLPWHAFVADLVLWFMIGIGIALFYILHLGAPLLTGLKILLGSSAFGLFGGMLCYLSMESRLIEHLQLVAGGASVAPEKLFSVSKKMLFFMVTVLGSMTAAILLMVFMDINYLLGHGAEDQITAGRNSLGRIGFDGAAEEILVGVRTRRGGLFQL